VWLLARDELYTGQGGILAEARLWPECDLRDLAAYRIQEGRSDGISPVRLRLPNSHARI